MIITEQLAEAKKHVLEVHKWIHAKADETPWAFDPHPLTGKLLDAAVAIDNALAAYEASKAPTPTLRECEEVLRKVLTERRAHVPPFLDDEIRALLAVVGKLRGGEE